MIPKSFSQAQKLYQFSVNLSKTWISKYYPKNKYQFFGVPIELAQAFSQHYFFSCLLEEQHLKGIWSQYPKTTSRNHRENLFHSLIKFFLKTTDILKSLLVSTESVENLNERFQLVFLASGRHLQDQIPLIFYLAKKFKILVVGKIPDDIQKRFYKQKITAINLSSARLFLARQERFMDLLFFLRFFGKKQGEHKLFGNPLWQKRLWYLRLEQFPEILALLKSAHNIFSKTKPALLLTTSSNDTFGASFALTAQKMKIPVAELQHGYTNVGTDKDFFHSDWQLAWGEKASEIRSKFSPKSAVVGCAFLKRPKIKLSSKLQIKSWSKIRILVLWTPPFGSTALFQLEQNLMTIENLVSGLAKIPKNFKIILRSHPSYNLSADLADSILPNNISVNNEGKIEDVIKKHDLVITQPTTAGFIATVYKKPLLFFNNSWLTQKYGDPLVDSGSALNVPLSDLNKIEQYILRLINDQNLIKKQRLAQEKFVKEYCSYFGKESCEQIAKFVRKIIDEKSSSN